jgi:hypothetical protein
VTPTLTDRDVVQEELQTILPSGNACWLSVQNFLSYRLLSKMSLKLKRAELSVLYVGVRRCHKRVLRVNCRPETDIENSRLQRVAW